MSGAEQFPVFGIDSNGEIFKKDKKDNSSNEWKKYPSYKRNPEGKLTEIKEKKEKKLEKRTKKRLIGVFLAMIAASLGAGVEVGRNLEETKEKNKIVQPSTTQMPKAPFRYEEGSHQTGVVPAIKDQVEDIKIETEKNHTETIFHHEAQSFDQMYDFNHRGKFNNADRAEKALENYWLEYYLHNKNKLAGKQKAYKELSQWLPAIDKRLDESGLGDARVKKILPLISIVENEKIDDKKATDKGAVGPFGFTGTTAKMRKVNLSIGGGIDERLDPVEAGVASYTLLKDNLDKIGDIDLAKAAYNGRAWGYVNKAKANHENISYHNYLHFSENILNANKELIESNRWEMYRAKKGETLATIVQKYLKKSRLTDAEKIFQANNSIGRERKLAEGEKIFVPLKLTVNHTKEEQKEAFGLLSAGIEQNLNYVAKINAIKTLKERGIIHETKPAAKFKEVRHPKGKKAIRFKDVAMQERIPVQLMEELNRKFVNNKIPPGAMYRRPVGSG